MTTLLNLEQSVAINLDKCDRCCARGAQAFVRGEQDFVFCQHHTNKYEAYLFMDGWTQLKHPKDLDKTLPNPVKLDTTPKLSTDNDEPDAGVPATI